MKTYIVQLEDHDDVISARDKISWSKARRILLVWPPKGRVLERRVDLLLLQRYSRQIGGQLALVTTRGQVKTEARELGIPVFADVVEAQESSWRQAQRSLRRKSLAPNMRFPERRPSDPSGLRLQREEFPFRIANHPWLRVICFTIGIFAFLILALAFAPGAVVEIKPARKTQQLTIAVWASPEIRSASPSGGLPAQTITVTVEGRDQARSTGQGYIPDHYATGQVLLTNLTDQPVDVPQGSVLLSKAADPAVSATNKSPAASGMRFLTTQPVSVPAGPAKSVMVAVRAEIPGRAGNLPAGKIQALEGDSGMRLLASNPAPTGGGTDQAGRAPTSQDYSKLREKLLSDLRKNALEELRAQVRPGQRLLENTARVHTVLQETREPPEGQPGDQLQLGLQAEFEALTVNEADVQAVAQAALDANQEKGFQPAPGAINISFASAPVIDEAAKNNPPENSLTNEPVTTGITARWKVKIARTLEAGWSEEQVVTSIRGRSLADARRVLQSTLRLVEPPAIQLTPGWWGWLPFLPARILVVSR